MKQRWPGRDMRRRRLAWLALAALLFQQLGMAALACEIVELPQPAMPMMADCDEMATHEQGMAEACVRSCTPDASASLEVRAAHVPPLALPAPPLTVDASLTAPKAGACTEVPPRAAGPPPMLLFCSLLI